MTMSRCKHCGARALPMQSACDYCGSAYARKAVEPIVPSPADPPPRGPRSHMHERFQRLLAHPDLSRYLREGPEQPVPEERREGVSKVMVVFALVAVIALTRGVGGDIRGLFRLPLMFFFLPLVFAIFRRRSRNRSFPASPLESEPARLMEVTEPWGRSQDPRPRALVEFPSGSRRFLRLRRDLVGQLKPEDMGVAFIKADVLIDFRRIPI